MIFETGSHATECYLILKGKLSLYKGYKSENHYHRSYPDGLGGNQIFIDILSDLKLVQSFWPGDVVGESEIINEIEASE